MKVTVPNLDYFASHDGEDNYLDAIGFDENEIEVCLKYKCNKIRCSCMGSWFTGNENMVASWIYRDDLAEEGKQCNINY